MLSGLFGVEGERSDKESEVETCGCDEYGAT